KQFDNRTRDLTLCHVYWKMSCVDFWQQLVNHALWQWPSLVDEHELFSVDLDVVGDEGDHRNCEISIRRAREGGGSLLAINDPSALAAIAVPRKRQESGVTSFDRTFRCRSSRSRKSCPWRQG